LVIALSVLGAAWLRLSRGPIIDVDELQCTLAVVALIAPVSGWHFVATTIAIVLTAHLLWERVIGPREGEEPDTWDGEVYDHEVPVESDPLLQTLEEIVADLLPAGRAQTSPGPG
jgi:hypothetical protein